MRIKPSSEPKSRRPWGVLWERVRAFSGGMRFRLVLTLCLVIVITGAIWYELEGFELIGPLLLGRRARTDPGDGLPALHLEVPPEDYQTMYGQWHESLRRGIMQVDESDWVQGRVRFDDQVYPVAIWLREESPEHWQESKWSLQIKLRDPPDARSQSTLLDMRSFVARSPVTGRFLEEWLYSEDLRRVGVLAPRYVFAHLWMNGEDWGIYALQEMVSDTLLASQGRPPGVSLRVDDSLSGRQRAQQAGVAPDGDGRAEIGRHPGLVQAGEGIAAKIARDPALQEQYAAAVGLLMGFQNGQLAPAQVFDAEQVGRYLAHAQWWGARYGARFEGERYYYRALTSRLEPIGGGAWPLEAAYEHRPGLAQYGDLEVMEAYAREVERIARPETLDVLRATYQDALRRHRTALAQEFPTSELAAPWQMLSERQAVLLRSLHPRETVHAYGAGQESGSCGNAACLDRIRVANLSTYPVILDELQVGERTASVGRDWIVGDRGTLLGTEPASPVVLAPLQGTLPRYLALRLPPSAQRQLWPHDVPLGEPVRLATHVAGLAEPTRVEVQRELLAPYTPAIPARPTLDQALALHPFLAASERTGFLELEPGDWDVAGDLVLPAGYGLLASEPARLRFDAGAVLLADGPLLLHGSEEGAIELAPKEHGWAGIVVLEAGDEIPSSLSYVTIRGASGVRRDGWHVPGGVTFYRSPVALSHGRLIDTIAPAALHVRQARFECEESEFGRVSADALRSEYAEGTVRGCRFHDVLGHAIAARGSRMDVRGLSMARVYDQGILARQNSVITVRGGYAEDVRVAVASSDGSHIQVEDMTIKQAWVAGLAAYTGERGDGPASVHASEITFESERAVQTLVQPGNSVRLEGEAVDAGSLEIARLSWRQGITATIRPLSYRLGSAIRLVGYDIVRRELVPGDPLHVTLYWHPVASLDRDYTVFLHVRDAAGEMVAGADSMPRENAYPTTAWSAGEVIEDRRAVPLDLPPGEYRIALGMYHLASGQRLPVRGPEGEAVADDTIVLDQGFRVN